VNLDRRRFIGLTAAAAAMPRVLPAQLPAGIPAVRLSGSDTTIERAAIRELRDSLRGSLLLRGDFGYDGARSVWNGMHDRYPALIVRAADARDVAHAVTFARERELLTSVKGGGHSFPGQCVADRALMIDLRSMNEVLVDVDGRRARSGGGALLYDLDFATQRHGLATTAGVVSHTGVGGFTLGGGYGRLNRKLGLTIDNLLAAEIVTADGQVRRITAEGHPDLFWAIRGGGGNFGVVTEFELRLHEVGTQMLGGEILWPVASARDVLAAYAELAPRLSDEMYLAPLMTTLPDGTGVVGMDVCHCGAPAAGERELQSLRKVARPLVDTVAVAPYLTLQTRKDGQFRPGIRVYVKGGMVRELSPALIDAMIEGFRANKGIGLSSHTAGGVVARVGVADTAWPHRAAATMISAVSMWTDPQQDAERVAAARSAWSLLKPHTGGYYGNIQSELDGARGNYGPAYERLTAIKRKYDPKNLFRLNDNIQPAAQGVSRSIALPARCR